MLRDGALTQLIVFVTLAKAAAVLYSLAGIGHAALVSLLMSASRSAAPRRRHRIAEGWQT